jgi:GTPase
MRFIDEVKLSLISGSGGNGCISFRREKYIAFGGPDGGDGGHGGDVYVVADSSRNTLVHFRGKKVYQAEDGGKGLGSQCNGRSGTSLELKVPVGTIIRLQETGEVIADLVTPGQRIRLAKGGNGGRGNLFFTTATNQAPKFAQEGQKGVQINVEFELKLLADIALIGMPNAGKSTLISILSAAKPKIADYPFTTLEPNLGVVTIDDDSFVVADIPGLIENASEGKGLGVRFLKHIERTSAFVHLVDCSFCLDEYEAYEQYVIVREELLKFNDELANKKEIVCLTKMDAMSEEDVQRFQDFFTEQLDRSVLPISAVSRQNLDLLKRLMRESIQKNSNAPTKNNEEDLFDFFQDL